MESGRPFRTTPTPMVALQHRDSQVMPHTAEIDDRLPDIAAPHTDDQWPLIAEK